MLAIHHIICTTIGLASDHSDLWHRRLAVGVEELGTMTDNAIMLLTYTGQESGHIHKGNNGDIEAVAEAHKTCSLIRRVDIKRPCQCSRLLCYDADGAAIETSKANDDVGGIILLHLEEVAIIDDRAYHRFHVIRLVWIVGNDRIQRLLSACGRVYRSDARWVFDVV